jgi:hypothetical protein
MTKKSTKPTVTNQEAKSIAKELNRNARYSKYISSVLNKEYSPLKFDDLTRKAALKINEKFFNKVTKTVLGR